MGGTRSQDVLVIDLDDTLIRTDMLFETLWATLSRRWLNCVPVLVAVQSGRAALKAKLTELGPVPAASLPYNDDVIAQINTWRQEGGQVALVSASDQTIVSEIAEHLGLFDAAHGSDGTTNLKGAQKAAFLKETFPEGFAYMGDSKADLEIWPHTTRAITVDAPTFLRAKVDALAVEGTHLNTRQKPLWHALFKALRPHQWLKNVLIFLPMLLAHQMTGGTFWLALLAFIAFSLIASSVYLLNDLLDLAADRAHPRKCKRPFAAGDLPLAWGTVLAPGLLMVGGILSALVGIQFLAIVLIYYVITTAYSFNLKRHMIIDICTLAGLYTIRLIAGGLATGTALSVWLAAFSIFFFFALAAIKRQAELIAGLNSGKEKADGRGYLTSDLPFISQMAVSAGYVSVLVMALYVNSQTVQTLYSNPLPLWGICLVLLYWISRIVMITHRGQMHDDPVVFAATDKVSVICALVIAALAVAATLL